MPCVLAAPSTLVTPDLWTRASEPSGPLRKRSLRSLRDSIMSETKPISETLFSMEGEHVRVFAHKVVFGQLQRDKAKELWFVRGADGTLTFPDRVVYAICPKLINIVTIGPVKLQAKNNIS